MSSRVSGVASAATALQTATLSLAAVDSSLSTAISTEVVNMSNAVTTAVMALVGGAPSTLDTLAEISALLSTGSIMHSMMDRVSSAVVSNSTARTADILGLENSVSVSKLALSTSDSTISASLSANVASRNSGVASVVTSLQTSVSSLTAVDSTLSGALSTNASSRVSGLASVATSLSTTTSSLVAVDSTLSAALSSNTVNRSSGVASVASLLSTTTSSLVAKDSTLSSTLSTNVVSRGSGITSLSTAISSNAVSLQTMDTAISTTFSTLSAGTQLTLLADTTLVNTTIAGLVGAAPSTLDTLNEIGSALNSGTDTITAINTILSNKAGATQVASLGTAALSLADQTSLTALETATGTKAAASTVTTLQSTVSVLETACSAHTSDVSLIQTITGLTANNFNLFAAAASNLDRLYRYFGYVNADNTIKYKINNLADPVLQSSSLTFGIDTTTNALTAVNQVATVTFDPLQTSAKYTVRSVETAITVTNGTYTFTASSTGMADYTANATAIVVTGQETTLRLAPLNSLTIPKLALSSYTYATPTVQTPYAATTWNDSTGQITQPLTFNYELGVQRLQIDGVNYAVAGTASMLYSLTYPPGTTGFIVVKVLNSTSKLESSVLTLSNVYNDYPQYAPPTLVNGTKTITLSGSTYTYSATFTSDANAIELHAFDAGTSTYSNVQTITSTGNSLFTVTRTYDVSRIGQPLFKLKAATSASKRVSDFTSVVNGEAITFSQPVQSSVSYTTLSQYSYRLSATYSVHSMASAVKVTTTTGATLIASQAASSGSVSFTIDFTESQVTSGITILVTTLANSYGLQSPASSSYALLGQYDVPVIVAGTKTVAAESGTTYTYTANYTSSSTTGIKVYDSAGVFVSTATTPGSGTFTVSYTYDANKIGQTAFKITSNADSSKRESALLDVVGETTSNTISEFTMGTKSLYSASVLPSVTTLIKPTYGSTWNQVGSLINTAGVAPNAVAMSADGSVIAIGYPDSNAVYAYKKNVSDQWIQLGNVINGSLTNTLFGSYVSISANGRTLAIGTNKEGYRTIGGTTASSSAGQFSNPTSIAFDAASGNFYVTDTNNSRVQKFTKDGVFILQFGSNGSGSGQFNNPVGIAVDYNGYVYVTDMYNHRIQKFTSNGVYISYFGSFGSGDGQFYYPTGIASYGDILYVCDQYNHRIQILNTASVGNGSITFLDKFGSSVIFSYPKYIAFNTFTTATAWSNTTQCVIVDASNSMTVYDIAYPWTRTLLRKFGVGGSGTGQFNDTRGVAFDPYGNVVVAQYNNNVIQKFTTTGTFLCQYGGSGTAAGKFTGPNGVAVDTQGNIYVTESTNNRLQIIEPVNVSMYAYSTVTTTTTGTWSKLGDSIMILTSENKLSMPVSISGDGRIVAIGYPYNDGPNGCITDNNGAVRVFKYSIPDIYTTTGKWNQLGNTMYGNYNELLGGSVSISANGRTIAIGKGKTRTVDQFGVSGTGDGQFSFTKGIAIDLYGTLWIAEGSRSIIQRFTPDGTYMSKLAPGLSGNVNGIAINQRTDVMYICDTGNNRIVRVTDFNSSQSIKTIGTTGTTNGNFNNPSYITIDSVANIYVTDTNNNRIQKFDWDGNYMSQFGTYGTGNGQLNSPLGTAIDASGNILVVDSGNNRIQKFSSSGTYISQFGSTGAGNGQFNNPGSIAIDVDGNIYVGEIGNDRIQKFSSSGTYISKFGSAKYHHITIYKNKLYAIGSVPSTSSLQVFSLATTSVSVYTCPDDMWSKNGNNFSAGAGVLSFRNSYAIATPGNGTPLWPFGIAMQFSQTTEGYYIYVVDTGNHRFIRYTSRGQYVSTFGSGTYGSANGQFASPRGIAVHPNGNIYIVDTGNNRVQIWILGSYWGSNFGSGGTGNGQFNAPNDIVIDASGNLYVTDTNNSRVQKFTADGTYISQFGTFGSGNGQFNTPYGMAFDASGNILVADQGNFRIQKFTSAGVYISQFGSQGSGNGQLGPHGVAVDANGCIYVSDHGNNRIQVFTSAGVYINQSKLSGSSTGQYSGVAGITIFNGILHVIDVDNKRINMYSISNSTYSGDVWSKLGNDINLYTNDISLNGPSVSLSGDGRCVAIGVNNSAGAAGNVADCGAVSVYKYSAPNSIITNGNWVQLGDTLYGDVTGDKLGTSVAISTDGTIVAAGAPFNDGGTGTVTDNRGKVIVRIYNSDTASWTATSISGATGDYAGNTIALSSNGTMIAVGSNNSVAGSNWVKAYNLTQTNPIIYTSGNTSVAEVYGQIALLTYSQGYADITVTQAGATKTVTMTSILPVPTIFVNNTRTVIAGTNNVGVAYYSDNNCSTYNPSTIQVTNVRDIACNENESRWVAIGYSDSPSTNAMSYSNDGINWIASVTTATTGFGSTNVRLAFNGTMWLAITYQGINYSYNGINWTAGTNPFSYCWAVGYSATRWVVGGGYGDMAYSDNGINWTSLGKIFYAYNFSGSVAGLASNGTGTRWVAVGVGVYSIMYSNNGIEWIPVPSSNEIFTSGNSVAYNGTRWVAIGNGPNSIAYSDDGITWIGLGKSIFNYNGEKVIWNKSLSIWMAVGTMNMQFGLHKNSARPDTVVYSSDGIVWTYGMPSPGSGYNIMSIMTICSAQPNITYANANKHRVVMCGDGTNTLSYSDDGGFAWSGLGKSIFSTTGWGVAFSPSLRRWVAVGQGTNTLAYSNDGINWSGLGTSIFSTAGYGVAWNGTRWVAVGQGTNSIAYSSDGITWTGVSGSTSIFSNFGKSVARNPDGTRWIAVGSGTNCIAYSNDGISWTGVTGSTSIFTTAALDVACNSAGTMWVAVGSGTNALAYSSDNGMSWTGNGSTTFSATTGLYGIEHNGSYWLTVGYNTWGSSLNGTTWFSSSVNFFSNNGNGKVKWIKSLSKWLAVGSGSLNVAYSYDGIVFTESSCQVSTNCNSIAVWEDFKIMVAVGQGTNSIAYSYDGLVWTGLGTSIFSTAGYEVAWNGTRWVAVGQGTNSIAYSADGGVTWTGLGASIFSTAGNGIACNETNGTQWVAVGSGTTNSIAYSTDGITWTGLGKDVFSSSGNGVGYNRNGNQWVAVGSGTNSIAYSYNIERWTGLGTSIFSISGNKVESNGNRWVAVGQGTNSIAYSNDGVAWIGLGTSIFSTAGYGVAWNGTQWVAVGQGTNSIAYSSNGITWTGVSGSATSIFSTAGQDVAWTGSLWVAVGQGTNSIAYSSDGITWTGVTGSTSIFSTAGLGVRFPLTVNHISRQVGELVSLSGLSISKSSGIITYTISSGSNLVTRVGNDLTCTAVGTVVIVASQAATDMYSSASKTIVMTINSPAGGGVELANGGTTLRYTGTTLLSEPTFVYADPRNTGTKEWFAIVTNTSKSMITDYAKNVSSGTSYFTPQRQSAVVPFNNIVTTLMTNMSSLFQSATTFNQTIASWDTSNVTNMTTMFSSASAFNQPIGSWNTAKVTDMNTMFYASAFNQSISNWNTANVTNMLFMFYTATAFNQPIGSWNTAKVTDMNTMFSASAFNQSLNSWNTINVQNMGGMFQGASTFNQPLNSWNTSNVTNMYGMFESASAFNQLISSWSVSKVQNMSRMFYGAQNFNQSSNGYSWYWDTSNVTDMSYMFYNAQNFNNFLYAWNTSKVTNMGFMFYNATNYNQQLNYFNTSKVTSMYSMFSYATNFNQQISDWTTTNVTNMDYMFNYASSFRNGFNGSMGWDVRNVTSMYAMFWGAYNFTGVNISYWNTSNVNNMNYMFYGATLFNGDLRNWNVTNCNSYWYFYTLSGMAGNPWAYVPSKFIGYS